MYIPTSDRTIIEQLLNDTDSSSIERLKQLVQKYGADISHGCFCKSHNKTVFLNKIRDWYIANGSND